MKDKFLNFLDSNDIILSEKIINKFDIYYENLCIWNKKFNLTSITDINEVYLKHFLDSATLIKYLNLSNIKTLCDVGTGAGFPGIVLKLIYPHLSLYLVEPTKKKTLFLHEIIKKLSLNDVFIINDRAENLVFYREFFDLVVTRALSSINIISELCLPLVKLNGIFSSYKGPNCFWEYKKTYKKIQKMGAFLYKKKSFTLEDDNKKKYYREFYFFKKQSKTPLKFPRNYSVIKKEG